MGYKEDILAHYGSQEIDFGELGFFVTNNYGEKRDGHPMICAIKFEQIMTDILGQNAYTMAKFINGNHEASCKLKWRYVTNLKDSFISER